MFFKSLLACCALTLACVADAAPPQTVAAPELAVEHTAFALELADGRVLKGRHMQGAIVHMAVEGGTLAAIRLGSIAPDPQDPDILRHEFQVQDEKGAWKPACAPNAQGETWGFPISLPQNHPGREGAITLTCASGAVGKCVRFGYKPWARGPHGEDLAPYHAACVHMVRADYGGDGAPHTRNGTDIDIYDRIGIQSPESLRDPGFAFEAGWAPSGAVCVARTRWSDLISIADLLKTYPQLPAPQSCTEASAASKDALLFNRSRP